MRQYCYTHKYIKIVKRSLLRGRLVVIFFLTCELIIFKPKFFSLGAQTKNLNCV